MVLEILLSYHRFICIQFFLSVVDAQKSQDSNALKRCTTDECTMKRYLIVLLPFYFLVFQNFTIFYHQRFGVRYLFLSLMLKILSLGTMYGTLFSTLFYQQFFEMLYDIQF